jgi:hypothetical protein
MTMQTVVITDPRTGPRETAATDTGGSRARSIAGVATIVGAFLVMAIVIGFIVAASLGLRADSHPVVVPDRLPAPDMIA